MDIGIGKRLGGGSDDGASDSDLPFDTKRQRTYIYEEEDSDDDDDDMFEDVPLAPHLDYASDDSMPDLGTVEIVIGEDESPPDGKRPRATVSRRARSVRRHHHMAELICHALVARILNDICAKDEILSLALSLVPEAVVEMVWTHMVPSKQHIRREWVAEDLQSLLSVFRDIVSRRSREPSIAQPGEQESVEGDFVRFIGTRRGTKPWHRPMLLAAILRAMTFDVRLCMAVNPPSLRMTVADGNEIEAAIRNLDILVTSGISTTQQTRKPARQPVYWIEVFDPVGDKWIPIDTPKEASTYAYVLANTISGATFDVTRRYSKDYAYTTLKQRLESVSTQTERGASTWWTRFLSRWGGDQDDASEANEMQQRALETAMPRRIADFAQNPHYVLERHLRQNQIIRPRNPIVGKIRGESVFLRENVCTLRSQMAWNRRGYRVIGSQAPAKTVNGSQLYGQWQTERIVAPPVVDGVVPRNEYGRVDLFTPSMLPAGSAHVCDAHAKRICRELGIDAVDAVVGFAFRRGVATPTIDGIVIPETAIDLLRDALQNDRQAQQERKRANMEARAVRNWRRLVKALRVHAEVEAEFSKRKPSGITFEEQAPGTESESESESEPEADTQGGFIL
ncbi:hypothetical protein GGI15_002543 [Coemansia interrupta]|uniref:Uncharacterized protein n=1 Tax=Coemansia interrupta TaxID=1126814 RepID=A0A9W8HJ23_9FUNG|nr:hypothetical protein GGI15_002543 [Coemansia interrupta]